MGDAVTVRTIIDGPRIAVLQLSSVSDGTGETAVAKIDPATLSGAPTAVAVDQIRYTTAGMSAKLHWQADTPVLLWGVPADDTMELCFRDMGGLQGPQFDPGWTGKITLTTSGHSSGDTYDILLTLHKKYGITPLAITNAATANCAENAALAFALTSNRTATWTIVGGADEAQFAIDGTTLTWVADGTQDFETPADANTDNVYAVTVRATDANGLTDDLAIAITVTDVAE